MKRNPTYSAGNLAEGAEEFSRTCLAEGREARFIPLPATWLNQDRFRDLFDEGGDDAAQAQEDPE